MNHHDGGKSIPVGIPSSWNWVLETWFLCCPDSSPPSTSWWKCSERISTEMRQNELWKNHQFKIFGQRTDALLLILVTQVDDQITSRYWLFSCSCLIFSWVDHLFFQDDVYFFSGWTFFSGWSLLSFGWSFVFRVDLLFLGLILFLGWPLVLRVDLLFLVDLLFFGLIFVFWVDLLFFGLIFCFLASFVLRLMFRFEVAVLFWRLIFCFSVWSFIFQFDLLFLELIFCF